MSDYLKIGSFGEEIATQYLENRKYNILERNFYCKQGEIDIVACKENEIVFCEVKTRSNRKYGEAIDSVDKNKQRHIWNAAEYYLYKNNLINSYVRFDVLEVYVTGSNVEINQVKNVFA